MTRDEYTFTEFVENLGCALDMFRDRHFEDFGEPALDHYSKRDLMEITFEAVDLLGCWRCFSCSEDTMDEDYALRNELWASYGVEGFLCVGCLEVRLGRKLVRADFKEGYPQSVERDAGWRAGVKLSDRLIARLTD